MGDQDQLLKKDRKDSIGSMFDSIAWRYDFLNHFLSFGTDHVWRRKAIRFIPGNYENANILDIATGTGDLAIEALKLKPGKVTGVDISEKMLEMGREKVARKGLTGKIELIQGSSEDLPFENNSFDMVMVAFGVRNFSDLMKGLNEINRVVRIGGHIMILEFSKPSAFPFKQVYHFYFRNILPIFGMIFSHDRKAYRYLHDSVMEFPGNNEFVRILQTAGFSELQQLKLTCGVVTVYTGIKPAKQ
jgi:demethylmenaquinone methyltransferase/2-methoxy-6-polyprenyl-1,4-benzoquinol methylase